MFNSIANLFRRQNHMTIARDELREARIELLQSQHYSEYYRHREAMLVSRISRLETYIANNETPQSVERIRHVGSVETGQRAKA